MFFEFLRVLSVLPRVELGRRTVGPRSLIRAVRERGMRASRRDADARRRLQRIIRYVDRCVPPSAGNCYRRALLEMSLDSGAAAEPLMLGLNAAGDPEPGHAWLGSAPTNAVYDCVFSI